MRPSKPILVLTLATMLSCALMSSSGRGEVYVNMLPDTVYGGYSIQSLSANGGGFTFDRDYQNAYGEELHLDPGPPFYIQAPIVASATYNPDGTVNKFGSISFESGGIGFLQEPFNIYVQTGDDHWGDIQADGPFNVRGSGFDPITISGGFEIRAGNLGGTDPLGTGNHSMTISYCTFNPTWHEYTWNVDPLLFRGGNVTIQNCTFSGFDSSFVRVFSFDRAGDLAPVWDFTMVSSRIENNTTLSQPVYLRSLRSVTLRNNDFVNNSFFALDLSGVVEVYNCGLGDIWGNGGTGNGIQALRFVETGGSYGNYITDSCAIFSKPELPIVSTPIQGEEGAAAYIAPGSVLKGDIDHWHAGYDYDAGIFIDTAGSAMLNNCRVRFGAGAVHARNDVTVRHCRIEYSDGFSLRFDGHGADSFVVTNTTIAHQEFSGVFYAGVTMHNANGGRQTLSMDSVTIYDVNYRGVDVICDAGHPAAAVITNSKIVGTGNHGLYAVLSQELESLQISNCVISGNAGSGIQLIEGYSDLPVVEIENCLIVGNGASVSPGLGVSIQTGVAHLLNNTIAYNINAGASFGGLNESQSTAVNNIFYRNGSYGFSMGDYSMPICSHNAFWQNDADEYEIYFRTPSGVVRTVEEVQALGGGYATNTHVDPSLVPELLGAVVSAVYNDTTAVSVITTTAGLFHGQSLRGAMLNPDTSGFGWYWIARNTADSIWVVGDVTGLAAPGDTFRVFDHHLIGGSGMVDAGDNNYARGVSDLDGDLRIIDGDENGTTYVDIGADEFNPDSGPQSPIRITYPTAGRFFAEGDTCRIEWISDGVDKVRILFKSDYTTPPGSGVDTLAQGISASGGSYDWAVPVVLSRKCVLMIEDEDQPGISAVSSPFTVKFYSLTRSAPDSILTLYRAEESGWRFGNDSATMWPDSWFNQIDYEHGVDPNTGRAYPPFFANELFYNARSSDFPAWTTFVEAFGTDQCYLNGPQGLIYRTEALTLWSDMKGPFNGSCYGFGVSSALAFFDSAAFLADYPQVGTFAALHDLDTSSARREVINRLYCHQRGSTHLQYKVDNIGDSPRQTLSELKEMLGDNYVDGRVLAIGSFGPNGGGHVVNPYRIERDAGQPGKYKVFIYDSNFPAPDAPTHEDSLVIDSVANSWSSMAYPNWTGPNGFCFLMDSSASYLNPPYLPTAAEARQRRGSTAAPAAGQINVYQCGLSRLLIDDGAGHIAGFDETSYRNDIPGAVPLIAFTGGESSPEGFVLTDGDYGIDMASAENTVISTSIWDGTVIYRYSRSGVDASQTDRLTYDTSLSISSTDAGAKQCQVACLVIGVDEEKNYVVEDLAVDNGESIELFSPDGLSFSILNSGVGKSFGLELWSTSAAGGVIVEAADVPLAAGALSTVAPNWSDPTMHDIKLLIDYEPDGTYDDTLSLNVVTSIGDEDHGAVLPYRFELAQNHPNPFNPVTTIGYGLPERSYVTIEIYNVLGQKVRSLVNCEQPAGLYAITWDGTNTAGSPVATGVYLYRFQAGDHVETKKMLLLK